MQSRVGELDLRVRTSSDRADAIAAAAQAFTCRVLERCDALLEERAPGRLVFMRELEMQWRLWDTALDADGEVDAVAGEMAAALEDEVQSRAASPDGPTLAAVFDDDAHYRAEFLRALSAGAQPAWFFAPLADEGPPPGILARREHRSLAEAVVMRLAGEDALDDVLSAMPEAVMQLANTLDVAEPFRTGETERTWSPAQRAVAELLRARHRTTDRSRDAAGAHQPAASEIVERIRPARADPREIVETSETQFGGWFYVLPPALELSIGEALWTACVSEPVCFTRIAEALLGGADAATDPAPRVFGGASAASRLAPVLAEQHAEAAHAMLEALVTAVPRRSSAGLPRMHLAIAHAAQRRLLVVTAPPSAFVTFAWPAESMDDLREALAMILAAWPKSAPPPFADPALSALDRTGRIKPVSASHAQPRIVEQGDDLFATALFTQAAGSLAYLFATCVGEPSIGAAQLVERYFAVPARIIVSSDSIEIAMPMERIDVAIRRAGLDRDPGWVPWLGKNVRFSFVEDDTRA